MILTILSLAVFVAGIITLKSWYSDLAEFIGVGLIVIGAIALATIAICWPISYHASLAEVERYHALKDTIELSRTAEISEYERATLTQKVAEYNADIASVKYWNENVLFDDFIADELAELEPLK